jgi:hypothetical protein
MRASIRSMHVMLTRFKTLFSAAVVAWGACCNVSCTTSKTPGAEQPTDDQKPAATSSSVDLDFLLSMSFAEAGAISGSKGEVPGVARVAADSIEVLRYGKAGDMRRIRARGNVFVEMDGGGQAARALAQEAYINENEVILRGMPALQRGSGLLEGLSDKTVFYIFGNQVRALGRHRMKSAPVAPVLADSSEAEVMAVLKNVPLTPPRLPDAGPWRAGPNPLLPPLDESAVPEQVKEEMRRQAEAEAVLQQSRGETQPMTSAPLDLPPTSATTPPPPPAPPPPSAE